MLQKDGCLGFLLRLSFLESKKRQKFFTAFPPKAVHVLPSRPSFVWVWTCDTPLYNEEGNTIRDGKGNVQLCGHKWKDKPNANHFRCPECDGKRVNKSTTDSSAYAFYVWREGYMGDTILTWLNTAPGEEVEDE